VSKIEKTKGGGFAGSGEPLNAVTGLIRINVGCGLSPTPGWENYDNSASIWIARYRPLISMLKIAGLSGEGRKQAIEWHRMHPVVRWANATKRIPVNDASVDVLYSSHMLEHLDGAEVDAFLRECLRVLAPGGILRVAVPDLERRIDKYIISKDADEFMSSLHVMGEKPKSILAKLVWLIVGPRHHSWMYDGPSLCRTLSAHGFLEPVVLRAGETTIPDPGSLNLSERS